MMHAFMHTHANLLILPLHECNDRVLFTAVSLHPLSLVKTLINGYWIHTNQTSLIGCPVVHLVQ